MRKKIILSSVAIGLAVIMVSGCGGSSPAKSSAASPATSSAAGVASSAAGSSAAAPSSTASSAAASVTAASSTAVSSSSAAAASTTASSSSTARTTSISDEMAAVEAKSLEFEKKDWGNMPQQEMNRTAAEWYELWDNELNSLWDRLTAEVTPAKKENLLVQQREWIAEKEKKVKEAGQEMEGGSAQPMLEYEEAKTLTRKRAYWFASLLAETRGEGLEVSDEVRKEVF